MKIIVDTNIPFMKGAAEQFGTVEYLAGADFTNERLRDADTLIIRTVAPMNKQLLDGTSVKLICSATIGYDHIDTAYCDAHNIAWTNAPGCNSGSVMQYIVSSLILMSRKHSFDLKEKTIGIIGAGNVGSKVAKACRLLGMRVLLNDPIREMAEGKQGFADMETIVQEADIITFHTPLAKEGEHTTYHLANEAFFASLAKRPIIINSARGAIVDTKAVKEALRNGQLLGAVIDCWEHEPEIDTEYMNMVDIATPHIAGYSADGKANASRMSLLSVADFYALNKEPINQIKELEPSNSIIDLSIFDGSDNRVHDAILTTYNPMTDFDRLKSAPHHFKQLRNEYPLRREYKAYTLLNATDEEVCLWVSFQLI